MELGPTADDHRRCSVVLLAEMVGMGGGKWTGFQSLAGLDEVSWSLVEVSLAWVVSSGWWWCAVVLGLSWR
jgi:hypothetical protein